MAEYSAGEYGDYSAEDYSAEEYSAEEFSDGPGDEFADDIPIRQQQHHHQPARPRAVPFALRSSPRPAAETVAAEAPAGEAPAGKTSAAETSETPAAETVAELQARIRQMQGTRLDTRSLPTHPAIAALLPGGSLKQGAAYSVERSATLLMSLLAGPSAAGSWCGVVGVPEFGVEAAAHYGVDLERLVLVPHPGDQWLGVTAAIADVMAVVVTRPPKQASDSSVARLAARLRQRGSTLIVLGPWPQTEAMLSISHSSWSGIGDGYGHLAAREVTVTVSTRAGAKPRSAKLWLPDRAEQFSSGSDLEACRGLGRIQLGMQELAG